MSLFRKLRSSTESLLPSEALQEATEAARNGIESGSSEGLSMVAFGSAFVLFTLPFIWFMPGALAKGSYEILVVLIFTFFGLVFIYYGIKAWRQYRRLGVITLHLDPLPGSLRGDVGGWFMVPGRVTQPWKVRLSCFAIKGSGDDKSYDMCFQREGWLHARGDALQTQLSFMFDLSAHTEAIQKKRASQTNDKMYWLLDVSGTLHTQGQLLSCERQWKVPVGHRHLRSTLVLPALSDQAGHIEIPEEAAEQLLDDLDISYTDDGVTIHSRGGKNRVIWWSILIFGLVMAAMPILGSLGAVEPVDNFGTLVGVAQTGIGVNILTFLVFMSVGGVLAMIAVVSLWGSLTATVRLPELQSYWSIFGIRFSRQRAKLTHPDQLTVSRAMTIRSGTQTIEKFNVDVSFNGKKHWLANNIEGRAAVTLLRQRLAEHFFPGEPLAPIQFPEK